MDARELTEKYWDHKRELSDLKKRVEDLEQLTNLLKLQVNDMSIDVKMLTKRRET